MLRVIVAGLLLGLGVGVLAAPPIGHADPQTCPPLCDQIPATAWIEPWAIPMNANYRWPALASVAVPVASARFTFEELCGTPRPLGDPRDYAVAARATIAAPATPPGHWQLRAQILHWRGETWRGGELANDVFDSAVAALRSCQRTAPQFSPSITTDEPGRLAAVISGPQIVHQYLIADPHSSTVSELVFWTTPGAGAGPAVPWPAVSDAQVLDAMSAPLCGAYLASCG